jgi:cytochrome c-type biogenesis protein CcmH/NrfF
LKRRFRKLVLVLALAVTPLALAADRNDRIRELSPNFMCVCGCHQLLSACNHFHCPSSGPMLADLGKQIDEGKSNEQIIASFIDKYGSTVLAAPPVSGFNLTAWIMPFAALAIGGLAAVYFVRRFRAQWAGPVQSNVDLTKYQDKVEEELKKFTPED